VSPLLPVPWAPLWSVWFSNLTLNKEKYKDVQPQIEVLLKNSEKLRHEMQDLIQKDIEVLSVLSLRFYSMPKNTDAEKGRPHPEDAGSPQTGLSGSF